jgi:hypothetical protein
MSGELPTGSFVLARANKVITAARSYNNMLPSLKNFRPAFATIVDNPSIMPINARTLGRTNDIHRGKAPKQIRVIITRSRIFQGSKISVNSWVLFLFENISLYDLPSFVVCEQPPPSPWTFDGNVYAS